MRLRTLGTIVIVATIAVVAAWTQTTLLLQVREHISGVVTLDPGAAYNFSFDVFPVGSNLQYSFVARAGPEGAVEIQSTDSNSDYEFSMTPAYRKNNLNPGSYQATIYSGSVWDPGTATNSTIAFDLVSVGYPAGSLGAVLYTTFPFLASVSLAALAVGASLVLAEPYAGPPSYCPYCGQPSGQIRCPHCGLPRLSVWGRKD